MSDTSQMPSNGKVYLPFTFGETVGRPLREWAYKTSTFPRGIKVTDLSQATADVQVETASAWFNNNFEPAAGSVFGFGSDGSTPNGNVEFGSGNFLNAVRAINPLLAEFDGVIPSETIGRVAADLDGLWSRKTASRPSTSEPSRAKAIVVADFNSDLSDDFLKTEWAYVTAAHRSGISARRLSLADNDEQLQTMRCWFLSNYTPSRKPLFAFDTPSGGWDQGGWFDGGICLKALTEEFGDLIDASTMEAAAAPLSSTMWERLPPEPVLDTRALVAEAIQEALPAAIDALRKELENKPSHVGPGHNSFGATDAEIGEALSATEDMKLAASSGDYSRALKIWQGIVGFFSKRAENIRDLTWTFASAAAESGGKAFGKVVVVGSLAWLAWDHAVIDKAHLVDALLHVAHEALR